MRNYLLFLVFVAITFIPSCKKDKNDSNPNILKQTIKISGFVVDENLATVSGAVVTYNGKTAITQNGFFVFDDITIPAGRQTIEASATGFFPSKVGFETVLNSSTQIKIAMVKKTLTGTIDATTGGSVNIGTATVSLPANAVSLNGSAYSGTINVFSFHHSPGNANFGERVPGGDLNAEDASGTERQLLSFGMVKVRLEDDLGNELTITSGQTATISLPIDAGQVAAAPASIKLWYLDEATAVWKEDGVAIKNGNFYQAQVTHFTNWNPDKDEDVAYIRGLIVDCNGENVNAAEASYSDNTPGTANLPQNNAHVDNNGTFRVKVPANFPLRVNVYPYGDRNNPVTVNVNPLGTAQQYDMGNITVPCGARVKAKLVDCNGFPVRGMVTFQSGIYIMSVDVWDGNLNVTLLPNTTYTLSPFCLDRGTYGDVTTITTGASSTVTDAGNITTCKCGGGQGSGDITNNYFTANGVGLTNQLFSFNSTGGNLSGMFSPNDTTYILVADGTRAETGDRLIFTISIKGLSSGTYTLSGSSDNVGDAMIAAVGYQSGTNTPLYSLYSSAGTLQITLGAVGQLISGTFSGTFDYDLIGGGSGTVTVTNGNCEAVRVM